MRAALVLPLALSLAACSRPEAPVVVVPADPPAAPGAAVPRFTGDVLSWVEGDALRYARLADGGFSPPATAASSPALVVDAADAPVVAPLAGDGLAAVWEEAIAGADYAQEVRVSVSSDGGKSWSKPTVPHRDSELVEHGFATVVPRPEPLAFDLVWLDGRLTAHGGATALYLSRFESGAFGEERPLDERVCDCCRTSAARLPDGRLIAVYRDRGDDERRDIAAVGEAGGPADVHDDGWRLKACPTNGPAVASAGNGVASAWFTAADRSPRVLAARAAEAGGSWSAPERLDGGDPVGRVAIAPLDDGSFAVAWVERRGGGAEVRVRRLLPGGGAGVAVPVGPIPGGRGGGTPALAPIGSREVVVAWNDGTRLRGARVPLP